MPVPEHPKVFISYSHDSREHVDRVLTLSDRLRADGIDCHLDQYEESPPEGWPRWMVNQIQDADFVLVVCTEHYERRFRGREARGRGLGAQWEGAIITQELYDAEAHNTMFIPVVFSPDHSADIPIVLRGATYYNLHTEDGYEALYRRLTNQPLIQKPELGRIRPMPPLARKQPMIQQQIPAKLLIPKQPFEPEMILIPAGEFLMGSDPQQDEDAEDDEQPQHRLSLPDYYLAKTPVTNAQYSAFVQATDHERPQHWGDGKIPSGKADHPVAYVSWFDTIAYCEWLSKVTGKTYGLPSEAEWEKGARGTDGLIYPWGNQPDATFFYSPHSNRDEAASVQAYPQRASPYGLLDMAGNVWQWTRSLWGREWTSSLWGRDWKRPDYQYPYEATDGRENLVAGRDVYRVLRGGAFFSDRVDLRCACRTRHTPDGCYRSFGFRVVIHP
jgi:formylglycine-generating enzyme required for sulfatase activity